MDVTLNGKAKDLKASSIAEMLSVLSLNKDMVAIELNNEILHRQHFETTKIKHNDKIEIVTVVGGG